MMTWWYIDGWQQRQEAWQNWGGWWFRPTEGLWKLWEKQHCASFVPGWLENHCDQCFVNWSIINSSYENVTYNNTLFMNVTISNTTMTNMAYYELTALNHTEMNVTETNSTWTSVAFISATIINSRKLNVTWLNSQWSRQQCLWKYNRGRLITSSKEPSGKPLSRWGWSWAELAKSGYVEHRADRRPVDCKDAYHWLDAASNVTVINSTLISMNNTNMTYLNYVLVNTTTLNCSFTNVTFLNVSYINVTAINSTLTNVTEMQATRINSTISSLILPPMRRSAMEHG